MRITAGMEVFNPVEIIHCHADVLDNLPKNPQDATTRMEIGYAVEPDEDETHFSLRVRMKVIHSAHIGDDKPFAIISHESACCVRLERCKSFTRDDFIESATEVGLRLLIATSRAQVQALAAMLTWPTRVDFPLISLNALMKCNEQVEKNYVDEA